MTCSRPPRGGRGSQPQLDEEPLLARASPPARGAWIATPASSPEAREAGVAPREGGVDRNHSTVTWSIDDERRPPRGGRGSQQPRQRDHRHRQHVAPREGGVDRNMTERMGIDPATMSPPARGAWIATATGCTARPASRSRPPRGGRGSQPSAACRTDGGARRPPRGGRGSQQQLRWQQLHDVQSPPARGVWIATSGRWSRSGT